MNILFTLLQLFIIQPIRNYTNQFLSKYVEIWTRLSKNEYPKQNLYLENNSQSLSEIEIINRDITSTSTISNISNYMCYLKYTNDFLREFPKHLPYTILSYNKYKNKN
jgi:hypothetical protein